MNLLVVDIETYYSKEYGLKKYTTEEYIRDERFEVIGVAVRVNDRPAQWFSGTVEDIKAFLSAYDWDNSFVLGHNMRFDAAILSWVFDIHPRGLFDTMGMAQIIHGLTHSVSLANLSELYGVGTKGTEVLDALGKHRTDFTADELQQYGKYCINDVNLTHAIFHKLKEHMSAKEMRLIDLTVKMFSEPKLELNKGLLLRHLTDVRTKKAELLASAGTDKETLMSNNKFAELLRQHNVQPPMKVSPTTSLYTFAFAKTDEGFKALLEHDDPVIQVLAAARLGNKSTLEETRTENFINIGNRGLLPVPLKYAGATVTHRWSGVDGINLQNLPRSSKLRDAICAPKGMKVIAADLSNIELRLAYWFARSYNKVEQIKRGVDLYKQSAADIMNIPYDEVDDDLRYIFKVVNLSGIYGVGAVKMHSILQQGGVDKRLEEVKRIVYAYRNANPELLRAWGDAGTMLESVAYGNNYSMGNGGIISSMKEGMMKPNGMVLGLPNLRKIRLDNGDTSWAYDKLMGRNNIPEYVHPSKTFQRCIQSLARDIIGEHLIEVAKKYDVVMTVHDELVMVCPEEDTANCVDYVTKCMTTAPAWCEDLPLGCKVGVGDNYGAAK